MMLICSSCNTRYLVNSGDLKPDGRIVRCATCDHEWFQGPNLVETGDVESSISSTLKKENNKLSNKNTFVSNLPSTYIKKENPSIMNSILIVLLFAVIIVVFWLMKNEGKGIIILLNFYIQEFYFNLKLIINDLAKLMNQIIN